MKQIRVMIVEDARVIRQFLEHIVGNDPRLEVAASVESGEEALHRMARVRPDVISMDIHLPGMSGFEATRRIMEEAPTPIVVVSGSLERSDLSGSMNALKVGALAVVEKPVGTTHDDYETLAERLCTQLAIMSQVKVVRQRFNRPRTRRPPHAGTPPPRSPRIVGMVASTGGPRAVQRILSELPGDFPVPIALVQHITTGFHEGFVQWLDRCCPLRVVTARDGMRAVAGHVHVAPPDHHLFVRGGQFRLRRDEPVSAQRPSGTVLLRSMAESAADRALGIVLTGMGDDGAEGACRIRQAGGHTIAEAESTAVVYGMPAAAARLGGACEQLPLDAIAPRLVQLACQVAEAG